MKCEQARFSQQPPSLMFPAAADGEDVAISFRGQFLTVMSGAVCKWVPSFDDLTWRQEYFGMRGCRPLDIDFGKPVIGQQPVQLVFHVG